jgi:GT2 family glycosyltransferase
MTDTPIPAISVIMPTYNRAYDLARTLRAYDQQVGSSEFELIAVDDGSNDETYQVLTSYQPTRYRLRVERLEKNSGPAAARNRGMLLAQAPLVIFVGDDILPDRYLIEGHLTAHRYYSNNQIAVLGKVQWPSDLPVNTLMAHIDGIGAQQFSYHYFKDGQEYDYRHFYTANISLKRDFLLSESKGFDTGFPFAAFEDVELSYRLAKRGLKIYYASALIGAHYHYHTIWTFSTRQYRAGLMACVLVKKHPEIREMIMGRGWQIRKLQFNTRSVLGRPQGGGAAEITNMLENEMLHTLSLYEWTESFQLDRVYIEVLKYFYYKGLIEGTTEDAVQRQKILSECARKFLAPVRGLLA